MRLFLVPRLILLLGWLLFAGLAHAVGSQSQSSKRQEADRMLDAISTEIRQSAYSNDERAKAAYHWIINQIDYDTEAQARLRVPDIAIADLLRSRKAVCQGYAELYTALAAKLGLQAITIQGYAKGLNYAPGDAFPRKNHVWNAVKLSKGWALLDATWGAGTVDRNGVFSRKPNYFWFDVEPSLFAMHHYPADPRLSFLPDPPTLAQWQHDFYIGAGLIEQMQFSGFSLHDIAEGIRQKSLPQVYAINEPNMAILKAPQSGVVRPGQDYEFLISSASSSSFYLQIDDAAFSKLSRTADLHGLSIQLPIAAKSLKLYMSSDPAGTLLRSYQLIASWVVTSR